MIPPSALSELVRKENKVKVTEAEELMTAARSLVKTLGVSETVRAKLVGRLDVRCVAFILRKGKEFEGKTYKNIGEIMQVSPYGVERASQKIEQGESDESSTFLFYFSKCF